MPNSTSQSATLSIVFFVGAKVFATFSADQCFPDSPHTSAQPSLNSPQFSLKLIQAYSPKFGEYGSDTSRMYSSALCRLLCTRPILTGRISAGCARFRLVH